MSDLLFLRPVLTPEEMAEADRRTIAAGTPVEVLMERAGRAVASQVRIARARGHHGEGFRVVVVCGKGNNGGDGLVTASAVRSWGAHVDVFELAAGVDETALDHAVVRASVVVDAMYGTGFEGVLEGDARKVVDVLERRRRRTIAVDIPSGVDGLTGAVEGPAVRAHETVCFAAAKPGLLFEPGASHAGALHVVDIGIDTGVNGWTCPLGVYDPSVPAARLPLARLFRPQDANKWQSGLLVVGGSGGMTGAPSLVSRAAMRAGAGIVWCAVPGDAAAGRASGGEVIAKALPATDDGALAGLGDILESVDRFEAVAVGPGLGTADPTRAAVRELVAQAAKPLVLDADGLNAFAGDVGVLQGRRAPTVLTPHDGEYARLMGEPVGADRVDAARRLAAASGCIALLKGRTTVVAEPGGRAAISRAGGPQLATAGSGDVLTGIIGGFIAAGGSDDALVDAFDLTVLATHAHGLAGDEAGHTGVIASDLVAALPRALSALLDDLPRLEP